MKRKERRNKNSLERFSLRFAIIRDQVWSTFNKRYPLLIAKTRINAGYGIRAKPCDQITPVSTLLRMLHVPPTACAL